jgi:2Fe-2S ferredoxin
MLQIEIVDQSGSKKTINAPENGTLMETIRDNEFDELQALCGGACSCATCHVHIDPTHFAKLPAMSEDEQELLSSSAHRNDYSRLSCQVPMTSVLDGATITIAPED